MSRSNTVRRPLRWLAPSTWTRVPTILGWSPGLRLVSGRAERCGCLSGVYVTAAGATLVVLDAKGEACDDLSHCGNVVLSRAPEPHA